MIAVLENAAIGTEIETLRIGDGHPLSIDPGLWPYQDRTELPTH